MRLVFLFLHEARIPFFCCGHPKGSPRWIKLCSQWQLILIISTAVFAIIKSRSAPWRIKTSCCSRKRIDVRHCWATRGSSSALSSKHLSARNSLLLPELVFRSWRRHIVLRRLRLRQPSLDVASKRPGNVTRNSSRLGRRGRWARMHDGCCFRLRDRRCYLAHKLIRSVHGRRCSVSGCPTSSAHCGVCVMHSFVRHQAHSFMCYLTGVLHSSFQCICCGSTY
mmetsp:Transcript_24633/g.52359  ORF Transcript_24633/g.52359 Transcript_24633/m.52359 type:complete len:223 (-) Transcript_24633:762-1430(-)